MLLADNTLKGAPFAKLHVKTPFYRGEIEALCLNDCFYDQELLYQTINFLIKI